jgi:SAM-dependent methyltransferase
MADAPRRASGTEGYAEEATALVERYESLDFARVHRDLMHLFPAPPADVIDIGAGTGRDAAALAALGHRVVAVEPTAELRTLARRLHPDPEIAWVDDALPDLAQVRRRGDCFDLVLLSAVWMHLDAAERRRAMPVLARLARPGGLVALSSRHGPVPPGRRMFEIDPAETRALAEAAGLQTVHQGERNDGFKRDGVRWSVLAFRKGTEPGG